MGCDVTVTALSATRSAAPESMQTPSANSRAKTSCSPRSRPPRGTQLARLRVRRDPGDLDGVCGEVDDEEDVMGDKPARRPDFDGGEVGRGDRAGGGSGDVVAEVGKRPTMRVWPQVAFSVACASLSIPVSGRARARAVPGVASLDRPPCGRLRELTLPRRCGTRIRRTWLARKPAIFAGDPCTESALPRWFLPPSRLRRSHRPAST